MMRIFESSSSAARLAAACEYIRSFPAATEILIVAASREAADDLARRIAAEAGATFGLHRFSFPQLVAELATRELAERGLAPATQLGADAVCARAAFEATDRELIPRLAPVSGYPGFARSLGATLKDLRLADIGPEAIGNGGGAEIAALLSIFQEDLEAARIADWATLVRLATAALRPGHNGRSPRWRGRPLVLLDLGVRSSLHSPFGSHRQVDTFNARPARSVKDLGRW
jgi:hypothetical protein